MENRPSRIVKMPDPSSQDPTLLDWHNLSYGPEISILTRNSASAIGFPIGFLAIRKSWLEGKDIKYKDGIIKEGYTINGIRMNEVQGFLRVGNHSLCTSTRLIDTFVIKQKAQRSSEDRPLRAQRESSKKAQKTNLLLKRKIKPLML